MSEAATAVSRRRRSDTGLVRATERDLRLLRFVGEQYAVTLPQLAVLMDRSIYAARWLRERWQRAGWVEARALLVGEPVFVWLTRRGTTAAGVDYPVWRPTPGALAHVAAVTHVRLDIERRHRGVVWISERQLAQEPSDRGIHRPDAIMELAGQVIAVEVELTQKERRRSRRVMQELVAVYGTVAYFAAPGPRRLLHELAEEIRADRVQVLPLPGASQ